MKKKLLFIVNVDWFFVSHRLPIALKAISDGYEVHLACVFTDKAEFLSKFGIVLHPVTFSRSGKNFFKELSSIWAIYSVIKDIRPDIVHSVTIKPVLYTGIVAHFTKVDGFVAAVSGLGYVFIAGNLKARLTKIFVKLLYKIAFSHKNLIVIFQNPSDKKIIIDSVGLSPNKSLLLKGSGVDLNQYVFKSENTKKIQVVMASRLLREKGVYDYVNAAKFLRDKYRDVKFLLVGEPDFGNPNSVILKDFEKWKNENYIEVLGYRSDIPEIFTDSNIVVLPSYYGEGLPKVLIEAAACGRAIVTTDNSGCREAVVDGETGILVPSKNIKQLTKAIETLIVDHEKRMRMGEKGRIFAVEHFDVNAIVHEHMNVYKFLLSQ